MNNLRLQRMLIASVAALAAVWAGWQVAEGSYGGPALLAFVAALLVLAKWRVRPETALAGAALFGYIIGNRGFAQLMLVPGLPSFVAELALGGVLALILARGALERRWPARRDALNAVVTAWLVIGGARLMVDLRAQGWWALRDSAVIYYALYFFVGQELGSEPTARRQLLGVLAWSLALLAPVFALSVAFPWFFLTHLIVQGVPMLMYKDDLVATMLAGGVFWFACKTTEGKDLPRRAASGAALTGALAGAFFPLTRAAMAGLAMAAVWQALGRRWRELGTVAIMLAVLAAATFGGELLARRPLEQTEVYRVAEYARSILDLDANGAEHSYPSAGNTKGRPDDNNQFRLVWWKTIASDTLREHPFFGAGFGYDLADRFVEAYGLEADTDFNVRSPHSIVFTMFGRMGFVGLALLAALGACMAWRTWKAAHRAGEELGLWCFCWVVFISACFGVVLEGPMGAVVFWTVLGLASTAGAAKPLAGAEKTAAPEEALHAAEEKV
ncbi:MAG TPA: O-antigen ligase family protein [Opitutaceae bacterium]|nr:O-antigen ligase family protein [Opitutaceae bacterium]